jgi:LuxR family maltose regulon positive regulatory protein
MVLLTAPAGYGKTSLVAEWLRERDDVVWYRATTESADVAAFSVGIANAVTPIVPRAGQRLRRRLAVADAPEDTAVALAEVLADDLAEWPGQAWLVIDDYHLVSESGTVDQFVDRLVEASPIRLVATARRRPSWATGRRVLHGDLLELTSDELAMTHDEAARMLAGHSPDAVRTFIAQAEGWPALIALARLSTSFEVPKARISSALFRYFAEEVFRREPSEIQAVMLAAAVPASVDPATADTVPDLPEVGSALARLSDEGLLREAEPGRLRFHPLVRDFLRRRLKIEDAALFAKLATRSIEAARRDGRWHEAFELAIELNGQQGGAEILGEAAPQLLAAGRIETLERWLAACGSVALRRPDLAAARAEVLVRRGDLLGAAALAHNAARRLRPEDEHYSRAWYLAGHSYLHLSRYELAFGCLAEARGTARSERELIQAYATSVHALINVGRADEAETLVGELERAVPDTLDAQMMLVECRSAATKQTRTPAGLWEAVEPLIPLAKYASDPVTACVFLELAAGLAIFRADYEQAFALTTDAVEICQSFRLGPVKTAFTLGWHAEAAIGLRRFVEAEAAMRTIRESATRRTKHAVLDEAVLRAKLALARGRARAVIEERRVLDEIGLPDALQSEFKGLVAIAAASLGELEVGSTDSPLVATGEGPEGRFYARVARVIARLVGGEDAATLQPAAVELLRECADAEILDAFVIGYRAYPPLLGLVAADEESLALVARMVRGANDEELAAQAGVLIPRREAPSERVSSLTRREAEVFNLVRQGLPNGEIARRLFVSESTVKVHVHHILEKLGAKSRLEAVVMTK